VYDGSNCKMNNEAWAKENKRTDEENLNLNGDGENLDSRAESSVVRWC
jgi:hypothetical protein